MTSHPSLTGNPGLACFCTRACCSTLAAAMLLLSSGTGRAMIEPEQSRPKRPLALDDGDIDLHGGLRLSLSSEPSFGFDDLFHMPIGVDFGLGAFGPVSGLEVGAELDLFFRPLFQMALGGHVRVAFFDKRTLALGFATTLPFGFATEHLGPAGWPLQFETPAFRVETRQAALQGAIRWTYVVQDGQDSKQLDADVAGVMRITDSLFAVIDFGTYLPELDGENIKLAAGLGLGWVMPWDLVGKARVDVPDLAVFNTWGLSFMVVKTWKAEAESVDWL